MKNSDLVKLNFNDWPLPDEYLLEIGRISVLWSALEAFLNHCIGKLAGFNDLADPTAFILLTHASFPQRLDMFKALCEQLVGQFPNLDGYTAVVQKINQAKDLRNDFMHYVMTLDSESGYVEMAKGKARGSLKVGVEKVTIADLRRASQLIHEGHLALQKLVLGRTVEPIWVQK